MPEIQYFLNQSNKRYEPERRGVASGNFGAQPGTPDAPADKPVPNRREVPNDSVRLSGQQFSHLIDEYKRYLTKFHSLAKAVRRLKMYSVALSGLLLAVAIVATHQSKGSYLFKYQSVEISAAQILSVFPMVHLFLITQYAITTYNKSKAQYEARVVDVGISRFGGITGLTALAAFGDYSTTLLSNGGALESVAKNVHRFAKACHSLFLLTLNGSAVAIGVGAAIHSSRSIGDERVRLMVWCYLLLCVLGCSAVVLSVLLAKIQKKWLLRRFMGTHNFIPAHFLPEL